MRPPKLWEYVACTFVVAIVGLLLLPTTVCACTSAERATCVSNLKRQGQAVSLYATDWNDRLPNRDRWGDQLGPYKKGDVFAHYIDKKEVKGGYSYNAALSDRLRGDFEEPDKIPLTYDSVNFGPNASDLVTSLPEPGRHKGRNNMSYLDGHARSLLPEAKP